MAKTHYIDNQGKQACGTKPWWYGLHDKPGVYMVEGPFGVGELTIHADPLLTSNDWDEVTCKLCLRKREPFEIDEWIEEQRESGAPVYLE